MAVWANTNSWIKENNSSLLLMSWVTAVGVLASVLTLSGEQTRQEQRHHVPSVSPTHNAIVVQNFFCFSVV